MKRAVLQVSDKPIPERCVIKPDHCAANVTDYCNCRGCEAEAALSEALQLAATEAHIAYLEAVVASLRENCQKEPQ